MKTDVEALREKLLASPSDFAVILKTHRNTVGHWRNGDKNPSAAARQLINAIEYLFDHGLLDDFLEKYNKKV